MDKKKSGLKIYNTLSRKKEEFIPIEEDRVTIYSCGPTLCQRIDLGQCRRFLFADLLRRYLEFKRYDVTHIMNVTDIDDRTIEGAEKAGVSLEVFTEQHYHTFLEDIDCLSIRRATEYPKASEYIEEMLEVTEKLVERGYAYEKFRSIYFDISRFEDYGKLSKIDLDKMKIGKTVDLDEYEKENPRDFTLLKRSTLNELKRGIFYETRWGHVRPGWHVECPAMALKTIGPTHDIHTSGMELVFPHHENAMAIAQAFSGKPLANYWVHNELVQVKGHSPSSKEGHMIFRDLLDEGFTGREIRYWLLSRHYRKPIFFSRGKLKAVKNTIAHIDMFVQKLHLMRPASDSLDIDQHVYDLRRKFTGSLDDDLNTAGALAALFSFIHTMNLIVDQNGLSAFGRQEVLNALEDINSVLCVMDLELLEPDKEMRDLLEKREQARKEKRWDEADRLRDELKQMGVEVTDTKDGPLWRRVRG
jgi:cysteinyl-tRNA synthetase